MVARFLVVLLIVPAIAAGQAPGQVPPVTHWCATPRPRDPLLLEAKQLGTSDDSVWASRREHNRFTRVPPDQVVPVRDEEICRRAAQAYADYFRRAVDPGWKNAAVLVVRIGDMYLVDDLRPRVGADAYWEVIVFTKDWQRRASYGGGS